ncbi:MAG: hypothetical protein R3345_10930 [Fulvivirga sp.]|nr:hypothetical protein [Fulvivirga sp.]
MKLRIKGNTLRLRLSQTEVKKFASEGQVSDSISFPAGQLIYTLLADDCDKIDASFNETFVTVSLPKDKGHHWATSEQVGLSAEVPISAEESLSVLVEKDFQCLKPREGEDESDLFRNPAATDEHC